MRRLGRVSPGLVAKPGAGERLLEVPAGWSRRWGGPGPSRSGEAGSLLLPIYLLKSPFLKARICRVLCALDSDAI